MKPFKPLWKGFWAGACMTAAIVSLVADYYGKEGYIELIRERWVSGTYSVPLAIAAFTVALFVLFRSGKDI